MTKHKHACLNDECIKEVVDLKFKIKELESENDRAIDLLTVKRKRISGLEEKCKSLNERMGRINHAVNSKV